MIFKGTNTKWILKDKQLYTPEGDLVPSLNNFSVSGRRTEEEVFGEDEYYIQAKYNDLLKSKSPELLSELVDLVWLIDRGATIEELEERIVQSKKVIKQSIEL